MPYWRHYRDELLATGAIAKMTVEKMREKRIAAESGAYCSFWRYLTGRPVRDLNSNHEYREVLEAV